MATNNNVTVTVDIAAKLDESSFDKSIDKVNSLIDKSQDIVNQGGSFEDFQYTYDSLFNMMSSLTDIQTRITGFKGAGKEIVQSFSEGFKDLENTLNSLGKAFDVFDKTPAKFANMGQSIMAMSMNLNNVAQLFSQINSASKKSLGWSMAEFNKHAPVMMTEMIHGKVRELNEGIFFNQTPTLDRYVNRLAQDKAVMQSFQKISQMQMSESEMKNNLRLMLLKYSPSATRSIGANVLASAPLKTEDSRLFAHDIIPEQFRKSFYDRGILDTKKQNAFAKLMETRASTGGKTGVSNAVYRELRKYVQENDEGFDLTDALREAGIMDVRGGRRMWAPNLSVVQASKLAGALSRDLNSAKRGYAFYDANPRDPENEKRMDRRMSRIVRANLGALSVLAQDSDIVADTDIDLTEWSKKPHGTGFVSSPVSPRAIKGNYIKSAGTATQFVIPKTEYQDGKLIFRDPNWQKKTGLFDERDDDQFVIATDSPLMNLASKLWAKNGFGQGNGTFGYGRDRKTGAPIYKTPPFLRVSTEGFFVDDGSGFNKKLNPEKEKELRRLMGGKHNYGGKNYEYAYQGENSITLIESSLKKEIEDWTEAHNVPSFFQGLNAKGLKGIEDRGKFIKQINAMKKGSSTSTDYEDLFGKFDHDIQTRIMNLSALYDAFGSEDSDSAKFKKGFRIDGAALGNAKTFRNGPLQMRSALGMAKYVLNPVNFNTLFSSFLGKIDESKVGESYGKNWLVSKGADGKLAYWAPSATAKAADVKKLMSGKGTDDELRELRRQKFFQANASDLDLILPDSAVKQFEGFQYLDAKRYERQYGTAGLAKAKKENRVKNGIVTLLPSEQGEMHNRATDSFMVMKSGYDFDNDPTIMSQQTAMSIGIDAETIKNSNQEFERRKRLLLSPGGRIEALKANPFYAEKLKSNPSFAYSTEAESYIEKQIRNLEEKREMGYIATPNTIKMHNRVAAVTPGAWIAPMLSSLGLKGKDLDAGMQALMPFMMDKTGQVITDPSLLKNLKGMIHRDPNAPGQQIFVSNAAFKNKAVMTQLKDLGITRSMLKEAVFLSPNQAYQQNTGDFDGDTVRLYTGLSEETMKRAENIKAEIDKIKAQEEAVLKTRGVLPEEKKKARDEITEKIQALQQYYDSTQHMGAASKLIRDAMAMKDSPQKWKLAYEGMKQYDFASSEIRTKGLEGKFSEEAMQVIKGGGSYERFVRMLQETAKASDEEYDPQRSIDQLFKSSLPTTNGTQGAIARALETVNAGSDLSLFKKNVQKMLTSRYGSSNTPESRAAKYYAEMFTKTMHGRLLTDEDISRGDTVAFEWLKSLTGRNVSVDSPEYAQYRRFAARVAEMNGSESYTRDNLLERREELYRQRAKKTGSGNTYALDTEIAAIDHILRTNDEREKTARTLTSESAQERVRNEQTAEADAKKIEEAKEEAEKEQEKMYWNRDNIQLNWTSFKHWIKGSHTFKGYTVSGKNQRKPSDFTVNLDNAADREAQAREEILNEHIDNEHIQSGLLMHAAFENYFRKSAAKELLPGQTVDDMYADLLGDDSSYIAKLANYGIGIKRTSKDGQPLRFSITGDPNNSAVQKLKKILPTADNNGKSAATHFVEQLKSAGFDTDSPVNVEGDFYDYRGKTGKGKKVEVPNGDWNFDANVPVWDKSGKPTGQYDEATRKRTHAKPDLMLRHRNGGIYVIDYKSSMEGAEESLLQSAYYSALIDRAAQTYYEEKNKARPQASVLQKYKAFSAAGHWDDKAGKYVSDIRGAIGFDPRGRQLALVERKDNEDLFNDVYNMAEEAWAQKRLDAMLVGDHSPYAMAEASRRTNAAKAEKRYTEARSEKHEMNEGELDYFLSRYQGDLDTLHKVRSSIYREKGLPETKFNRFETYRRNIEEVLNDDVINAVAERFGEDSPVTKQLKEEMASKGRLLQDINLAGRQAAIDDWMKLSEEVPGIISGAKASRTGSVLMNINDRVRQAQTARDFLKKQEFEDENGNKIRLYKYWEKTADGRDVLTDVNKTDRQQANGFIVDEKQLPATMSDSSKKIAVARAKDLKTEFESSLLAQSSAEKKIAESIEKYLPTDQKIEDQNWASITGEIQNPTTILENAFAKKKEEIVSKINSWNKDISELQKDITDGIVQDGPLKDAYLKVINDRQARIKNAEKYLGSDKVDAKILEDEKKRLGMITETPSEIVQKWLNERNAVLLEEAKKEEQSYLTEDGYLKDKRNEKKYREARKRRLELEAGRSEYKPIAKEIEDALNRQRENQYQDYYNAISGNNLTPEEESKRKTANLREQIQSARNKFGKNDPMRKRYQDLLDDKNLWDAFEKDNLEEAKQKKLRKDLNFTRTGLALESAISGAPIDEQKYAELQAEDIKIQIEERKKAISEELKGLTPGKKSRDLRNELFKLENMSIGDVQDRLAGLAESSQTLKRNRNAEQLQSLNQLFSVTGMASLNDLISSAVRNAQNKVEEYISSNPQLSKAQQDSLRAQFADTSNITDRVREEYERQQQNEAASIYQRSIALNETITGRRGTAQERAELRTLQLRRDIAQQMHDLEYGATPSTMQEAQRRIDEYNRLAGMDYTAANQRFLEEELRNDQQRRISEDINKRQTEASFGNRALTKEERIAQRRDQLLLQAQQRAEEIRRVGGNADAYLATHDFIKATAVATEQENLNEADRQLKLRHQEEQNRMRGDNLLHQQEMSQMQFQRQRRRQYSRSRIAQSMYGLEDRQISLREQVRGWEQQNTSLQNRQDEIAQQLARQDLTQEQRDALTSEQTRNADSINANAEAIRRANEEVNQLGTFTARAGAAFQGLSQSIGMVAQRLGRQLFMKALNETKQFVKQFDASMNEIQAITLKSDKEMGSVRSQTINKALGLRTSVSNVATTEAALYRQGLSDAEVSSRTESIIKFATVTKLNVAEATKIITTALQNDLVPSAEAAMDALVALGDSAATTAAEIGKGMQKAAASAKVAGVSYAELTALLTIGTSDTQLSGTQVGTALQTVFSRMRRLSISGYAADQNGEKTTASDAEAALKSVGVDLWDNKTIGKMRSAYDVLSDLSKVWQNLSDAQKNIVMNAMAGTRQTNVFSTLMEGMSEDGGETLEKYLGLAEGSEGITQSKYEIAMQSLSAAMDELKSSWDAVVESFVSNGIITGILDGVSGFLQNIANIAQSGDAGKIGTIFSAIAAGITGLGVAAMASMAGLGPVATILGVIAGLVTGGIGVALSKGLSSLISPESYEDIEKRTREEDLQRITDAGNVRSNTISKKEDAIQKVEKYASVFEKFKNKQDSIAKSDASRDLINSLNELSDAFPNLDGPIQDSIDNLENWKEAIIKAKEEVDNLKSEDKKQSIIDATDYIATHGDALYSEYLKKYTGKRKPLSDEELEILENSQKGKKFQGLISGDKLSWEGSAAVDLSNDQQKVEYFQSLIGYYAQDDVIKIIGEFIQNSDIENAFSKGSDLITEKDPSKRVRLLKNEDMIKIVNDLLYQYSDEIVDPSSLTQEELTSIGLNYIENALIPALSNSFTKNATEKYSADYLKTAFLNGIKKEIMNEESEYTFFKDGIIDNNEISRYFEDFLHSETGIDKTVESNLEKENYDYYIEDNSEKGFVGFTSEDEASEYARKHGIPIANIKSGKGNSAYQTAKQRISAKRQEANANSRQMLLENLMYGYEEGAGFNLLSEKDQNQMAFKKIRELGEQRTEENIKTIKADLLKMSSEQGLNAYHSVKELEDAAKLGGWDADLANAISGNSNAMAAYLANDYDALVKSLQEEMAGKSTPQSRADLMRSFGSMFSGNRAAVAAFRTEGLTSDSYKQWQSFFGDNADRILDELAAGTLEQDKDLYDEYQRILAEKGLKIGTGKTFTGAETTAFAQRILSGGFESWAAAQEGLTDWTTDEWSALENKYPALKQYMQLSEEQRKTQEGQNLLREVKIQISTSGIQSLEDANKVLEGTTKLIENLQKGGDIAIKAKLEFENEVFNAEQQRALLENGTFAEQVAAISALTGMSSTQIQQMGFGNAYNYAIDVDNARRERTAQSRVVTSQFEAAQKMSDIHGTEYRYDAENDILYKKTKHGEVRASRAQRKEFDSYVTPYQLDETGKPVREDLGYTLTRTNSQQEILAAQRRILNGSLTAENAGEEYALYEQAFNGLTNEQKNYLLSRKEYEEAYRIYSSESSAETYEDLQAARRKYEDDRAKAYGQLGLSEKELQEQDALEEARLHRYDSAEAAERYAQLQYYQNNKAALAAQNIYENRGSNITEFLANAAADKDFLELAGTQGWADFKRDYLNAEGTGLKEDVSFEQAMQAFSNLTAYSQSSGYVSRAERVRQARAALLAEDRTSKEVNGEAIRQIFGDEIYDQWQKGKDLTGNKIVQQQLRNYELGLTGPTSAQKYQGIQKISALPDFMLRAALSSESTEKYMDEIMSGFSRWDEYKAAVKAGETGTEEFKVLEQELENFRKNSQIEFEVTGVKALEEAGEVLAGTAEQVEKLKKGGTIELEVLTTIRSQAFESGQTEAKLRSGTWAEQNAAAMSILGMSEEEFWATGREEAIRQAEERKEATRSEVAATWAQRYLGASEENKQQIIEDARSEGYEFSQGLFGLPIFSFNQLLLKKKTPTVAAVRERQLETNKENDLTRLFRSIAEDYFNENEYATIADFLGSENYDKLYQNDSTFKTMIDAGISDNEIVNYARSKVIGQRGSVYDRYSAGWAGLFSGNRLLGTEDLTKARKAYAKASPELKAYYDSFLGELPTSLKEYIIDNKGNAEEVVQQSAQAYYETQFEGFRNGQELAQKRAVFEYGTEEEQRKISSDYANQFRQMSTAQAALLAISSGEDTTSQRQKFASALGLEFENIEKLSTEDLQKLLSGKVVKLLEESITTMDIDLSGDNVRERLQEVANDTTNSAHDAVSVMLEIFDKLGLDLQDVANNLNGSAGTTSFSEAYRKGVDALSGRASNQRAIDFLYENREALLRGEQLDDHIEGWKDEYGEVFSNNPELFAAYQLTREQEQYRPMFDSMLTNLHQGGNKNYDYYNAEANAMFGDYYQNGQFNIDETSAKNFASLLETLRSGDETKAIFDDWTSGMSDVTSVINDLNSSDPKRVSKAIETLNDQMNKKKAEEITKYGKSASNMATALAQLKKGGKDAAEGMAMLRRNVETLQDEMTAVGKAQGKTGKQLDSKTLGFLDQLFPNLSSEDIKTMTKDQLADLLRDAPDAINEAYTDTVQSIMDDAVSEAQSYADQNNLSFDLSQIQISADGTPDFSSLDAGVAAILTAAWSKISGLEGDLGSVTVEGIIDGQTLSLKGIVNKNPKGTYHGGGGGGGGGKSETDKMLERQKRKVSDIEHQGKLLEIYGKEYDFLNDYDAQTKNIDAQIANQERLRAAYAANIAEMKSQLSTVEEGSDDWNKLKDSINSAEEAMASINGTIRELNSQKIQIVQQIIDREKSPVEHRTNIAQAYAQRYQTLDRFEAYATAQSQIQSALNSKMSTNREAISHWEEVLSETVKESDDWYEIRDKIWALEEENLQLQSDILSSKIEVDRARAAKMVKDVEDAIAGQEHQSAILNTYLDMYQQHYMFDDYREALTTIGENLQTKKDKQLELIEKLKAQYEKKQKQIDKEKKKKKPNQENIAVLLKQQEAYLEALREAELQYAQTDVELDTNQRAIEESFINEIEKRNEPKEKALEHESKMLELYAKKYKEDKDYYNAEKVLERNAEAAAEKIDLQKEKLQDYLNLQNSGKITEGSQQWYNLQDAIYATTEAIAELENQIDELTQLKFDHIVEMFKEGTNDIYSAIAGDKTFFGSSESSLKDNINKYIEEMQKDYSDTAKYFEDEIAPVQERIDEINEKHREGIETATEKRDVAAEKAKPYEEKLEAAQAKLTEFDTNKTAAYEKIKTEKSEAIATAKSAKEAALADAQTAYDLSAEAALKKKNEALQEIDLDDSLTDKEKTAAKKAVNTQYNKEIKAAKSTYETSKTAANNAYKKASNAANSAYKSEKTKLDKQYSAANRKKLTTAITKAQKALKSYAANKEKTQSELDSLIAALEEELAPDKETLEGIENKRDMTLEEKEEYLNRLVEDAQDVQSELIQGSLVGMDQLTHERNLIGYQQTKYQNRGELTNVGHALEWDHDTIETMIDETKQQIDAWKEFRETVKDNPEMYDKVTEKIREQEEALAKYTVELEKNNDAQEKNVEAIRQARIKAENEADKAIRAIIQKQRNMLAATVTMQNTILETIRKSYQEQWDQLRSLLIELLENPKAYLLQRGMKIRA